MVPNNVESELEAEVESPKEKKTKPKNIQSHENSASRAENVYAQSTDLSAEMLCLDTQPNKGEPIYEWTSLLVKWKFQGALVLISTGKHMTSSSDAHRVAKCVMTCVTQEVKDLYHLLDHEFLPLDLASKVQPLLTKISKLRGTRVSQVYQSMNIENLSKMITFFEFSVVEKISVDAVKHNFLAMKVDHMKGVVAFGNSVTITPEVISKKLHWEIINKLVGLYCESHLGKRQLAYDRRKSVYTARPLPFSSKDFVIKLVDQDRGARKDREFKVSFKFVAKPDIHHLQEFMRGRQLDTSQETIQVLDVVFRATLSMNNAVVGRSFFSPSFGVGDLGNGFKYWKGFYQSLRPIQMGLSLNIDMSARAFYEPILVTDFVAKYFNVKDMIRPLSDQECLKVKRALRGIKVELAHRKHVQCRRISGLSVQPTNQLT
ncbi:unnamed protein product [Camellia sinensis]